LRVHFTDNGWDDYLYWCNHDSDTHQRLNDLIEDARRTPFTGIGKPEPLKGELQGFWSRRITREHRLVYLLVVGFRLCRSGDRERSVEDIGPPCHCDDSVTVTAGNHHFVILKACEIIAMTAPSPSAPVRVRR
jgi:toxin YoeB